MKVLGSSRKRERQHEESYQSSKRLLSAGFRSLDLSDGQQSTSCKSFFSLGGSASGADGVSINDDLYDGDNEVEEDPKDNDDDFSVSIDKDSCSDDSEDEDEHAVPHSVGIYGAKSGAGELQSGAADEILISVLKGGSHKYIRKVDYLIDEVIRKARKTEYSAVGDNAYSDIPNSVGPHPLTDRPLGTLWPTVVPTLGGPAESMNRETLRGMRQRECGDTRGGVDGNVERMEISSEDAHAMQVVTTSAGTAGRRGSRSGRSGL
ncbi:hypothetical protein B484DRAFT_457121, partial [Ochromonadaceae sp. CCMP2298]